MTLLLWMMGVEDKGIASSIVPASGDADCWHSAVDR